MTGCIDDLVTLVFTGLAPLVVEDVADQGDWIQVHARTPGGVVSGLWCVDGAGAFINSEKAYFLNEWKWIAPDSLGVASRRRQIAPNYELTILAPVGKTCGYLVRSTTILAGTLTLVMHYGSGKWLVASHLGIAPPVPGWPSAWWNITGMDLSPESEEMGDAGHPLAPSPRGAGS